MDRQRRLRLAHVLKLKDRASASPLSASANCQPQSTTPSTTSVQSSPNPPPSLPSPIVAILLVLAEAGAPSAPLDKGKRVVEVISDDEDSAEGQAFKRQRTQRAPQTVTYATSSSYGDEFLREDPPSATSLSQPMILEGGLEAEHTSTPPPAPELPLPIQDSLRGFFGKASPRDQTERPQRESLYYHMGAFMSCAHSWHMQARAKGAQVFTFRALEKKVASLTEEKEKLANRWGRQEEAYKATLKVSQKANEDVNKQLHEVAQANVELLNQVVPLRTKIIDLEAAAETSKAYRKKLEDQCVDQEQTLGKTEVALAGKTDECSCLTTENTFLQANVQELISALASKDQEMTAQAANFKIAEEKQVEEAATGFADGFAEALV